MRTSEPDCPFCAIAAGLDHEVRVVYRTVDTVAFFPTEPATLGHTLVAPASHVADVWSLDVELAASLSRVTLRVANAIRDGIRPQGLNLIQSNGAAASQTVAHLHVHVVPRWEGDAIGRIWPPETDYTEDQKDDAWGRIRAELQTPNGL